MLSKTDGQLLFAPFSLAFAFRCPAACMIVVLLRVFVGLSFSVSFVAITLPFVARFSSLDSCRGHSLLRLGVSPF